MRLSPVLNRGGTDAWRALSSSLRSIAISVVSFIGFVFLQYQIFGSDKAMNEFIDHAIAVGAAVGFVVIPVLLWNLWLAPYRIMNERLDDALAELPTSPDQFTPDPPEPADVSAYANYSNFSLNDAACLWSGLEPHSPIQDATARANLGLLKAAVIGRTLECTWGEDLALVVDALEGRIEVPDSIRLSRDALRAYAEFIGDVPEFLREDV